MNMFFFICCVNFLDKLMLENGFIDNIANTQHDLERYAVFPHFVVPDEGLKACNAVFAVIQDMTSYGQRDIFDTL